MHRAAERRVVVVPANRIDLGAARNQELGNIDAVVVRRDVERALALAAFDVGRSAEIQQELGGVAAVVFRRREERLGRAEGTRGVWRSRRGSRACPTGGTRQMSAASG